ncbi:response regulator [Paenibacillus sp. CF384]|uniref:response regulator transcription factor n=1 Tax=Paenibacillus sp. CF384 TaxID=1884382 RepID=UPI00089D7A76|nr:response regulator [Paenibacillus sp. CF384]SDW77389.1 two-component system, response regulator YesN [Paenibacillus sp. CF384]
MKIIIADDEPLVRIGIKSSFNWAAAGMEIVGEAADGEEALQLIEELQPDIVILDIKMPKKDGIEVLTALRDRGMRTKVIILSSFDDFVHVKQAMQLGALDYFHKPSMNVQEIMSLLQNIQAEARENRMSGAEAVEIKPGKAAILRELLAGSSERAEETKLKESNLYTVLFTVKRFGQILKRYTQGNAAYLPATIFNIVSELLAKEQETECMQLEYNAFLVVLSHGDSNSTQASFTHVNEIVYMIHNAMKRFLNIEPIFGISNAFHAYAELPQAVDQARRALDMKFYHPNDPVLYYQNRKRDDESVQEQIGAAIVAMKDCLKEEKYDSFAAALASWEQLLQNYEGMNERDVKKVYEGLLFMLSVGDDEDLPAGEAAQLDDFTECSSYYHAVFNEKLRARIIGKNKEYSPLIRNVVQFINTRYSENISLKLLGDTFHSSPNYISRLFKQEVGRGVFDYLNVVRIRQAKELLKDYRNKIYEIAEKVGFNSQVHFAIVFNKYEGMSPSDYRKELS